jgi:hypothetical protein
MQANAPTAEQRTAREQRRAVHALRRINDKFTVVTSVTFKTAAGVTLAAQQVRLEYDNRASESTSAAGAAPRMQLIVYGIRQHATLPDTDMKEGYRFVYGNDEYRITDIIDTIGERQGIAVATG